MAYERSNILQWQRAEAVKEQLDMKSLVLFTVRIRLLQSYTHWINNDFLEQRAKTTKNLKC